MIFQPSGYSISYKQNDFHMTKVQYISHKWLNWGMNFWPHGSYSGVCRHYATKNFESWPLTFKIDTNRSKQIVARNILFTCICTKFWILRIGEGGKYQCGTPKTMTKRTFVARLTLFSSVCPYSPQYKEMPCPTATHEPTGTSPSFKSRKGIAEVFKIDWWFQLNLSCIKNWD